MDIKRDGDNVSEQDKTYTTIVPYEVVRAGEYMLNGKTKDVTSISTGAEIVILFLDRDKAFGLDKDSFIRELLKCPELVAEIMNTETVTA